MHLKKKKKSRNKNQENLKKILKHYSKPLKNKSSNLPDRSVPKGPVQNQTYQHYSKNPKLVPTTGKHQKSAKKPTKSKKNIKTFEQTLQY